jgi:hypothetical protein
MPGAPRGRPSVRRIRASSGLVVGTVPAVEQDRLDWLGRHGGWVLVVFGVALVAVSVVVADKQAVASILAFSGVAAAVFGVLLSRLEGSFEFGPTKFSATLTAARSAGAREDLTLEERANLMLRLLDVRGDAQAGPALVGPESTDVEIDRLRPDEPGAIPDTPPLPRPIAFIVTGATDQIHRVGFGFEQHVAEAFRRDGWGVEVLRGGADFGVDLMATKDDWRLYIEVKLSRRLSVNSGALTVAAREVLMSVPRLVVWEVPVEGW